ncbi:MAG: trypsin-like peptidase domain-containing protein, partial [Hyphomicrobiaceae bacterium]
MSLKTGSTRPWRRFLGELRRQRWLRAAGSAGAIAVALLMLAANETASAGPGLSPGSMPASQSMIRPIAVFGTDDRTAVPRRYQAIAERIGLFFSNPARTVCTAFCVAPNIVATAAHCLAQPGGAPARVADFMFARGYDKRREFTRIEGFTTGSTSQSIMSGQFHHRVKPPIDATHDWALVRLSRNACPDGGFAVTPKTVDELMTAARYKRIFQISYHRDWTQWRAAYSAPCQVQRNFNGISWSTIEPDFMDADKMILHQCDTGGASSGSPILMEGAGGISVVGINVGTYVQAKILTDKGKVTLRERAETVANTAVNAIAFADGIEQLRKAAILASGKPIRDLQLRLAA